MTKKTFSYLLLFSTLLALCSTSCFLPNVVEPAGDNGEKLTQETCGNGELDPRETCDDANKEDGDGCSSSCQTEEYWTCQEGVCKPLCGDGVILAPEQCDDRNTDNDDGCSSTCVVEEGWSCVYDQNESKCRKFCGDGNLGPGENCDDGNHENGDGCSSTCTIEKGWECVFTSGNSSCYPLCGNGRLDTDEACDDGNRVGGDGCSETCLVEDGWECTLPKLSSSTEENEVYLPVFFKRYLNEKAMFSNLGGFSFGCPNSGDQLERELENVPEIANVKICKDPHYQNSKFDAWYTNTKATKTVSSLIPKLVKFVKKGNSYYNHNVAGVMYEDLYSYENDTLKKIVERKSGLYTTQFVVDFIYNAKGIKVDFMADDDLYVYLNDTLNTSLPGSHSPKPVEANFTDLTPGDSNLVRFNIFHANRAEEGTLETTLPLTLSAPSFCTRCGDGIVNGPGVTVKPPETRWNEECDDGNTEDGDGCSSTCKIEEGWECYSGLLGGTVHCKKK